jgi:undecaprenyl-diphosphatase
VSILPFAALLVAVLASDLAPLGMDRWWAGVMADLRTPLMTSFQTLVSTLGGGLIGGLVVPLTLFALLGRLVSTRAAITFGTAVVCSAAIVAVNKDLVARPRPDGQLVQTIDSGSFPSGHVAHAATLTVALALIVRRRWLIAVAVIWPALMALSRTYLSVHWLSDTIAGASVGTCVALVVVAAGSWQEARARRQPGTTTL